MTQGCLMARALTGPDGVVDALLAQTNLGRETKRIAAKYQEALGTRDTSREEDSRLAEIVRRYLVGFYGKVADPPDPEPARRRRKPA